MKKYLTLTVTIIAAVFLLCSCISTADRRSTVSVSGEGVVELVPDMASFNVSVSETEETTRQAQQEVNSKIEKVIAILKEAGVDESDIKTSSLDIYTSWDWVDGRQVKRGETMTQNLSVKVYDLAVLGRIMDRLGDVDGVSVSSVSLDAKDKTAAVEKARTLAIADAKAKAQAYCDACSLVLSDPISISEGYSTYNPLRYDAAAPEMYSMAKASNATAIPTGTLSCKVSVSTVWHIR